jgi:MtfA peptidase
VLSWRAVKAGAADPSDGQNTVIHEFAHQLDQESGAADGTPLEIPSSYEVWSKILQAGFERLQQAEADGTASALNYYGTTNPAEFFAVAVESFFERPRSMRAEYPELYGQLKRYFKQDPAEEFSGTT